jgi:hypothetical protein
LVKFELELADLHCKHAALVFTSGYVSNQTGIDDLRRRGTRRWHVRRRGAGIAERDRVRAIVGGIAWFR